MNEFDESSLETSGSLSANAENTYSIAGRARVRAQLQADIEAYLNQGGTIHEVENGLRSDGLSKAGIGFNGREF